MGFNIFRTDCRSNLIYIVETAFEGVKNYALIGGVALQAHSFSYNDRNVRETKDVDFIVQEDYFQRVLDNLISNRIFYKRGEKFNMPCLLVSPQKGKWSYTICSYEEIPPYIKIELNRAYVNVEELESLFVNKLLLSLEVRGEEKDIQDLDKILRYIKLRGDISFGVLRKAVEFYSNRYDIDRESVEKAVHVCLENKGIIDDSSKYIEITPEEKEDILNSLKGKGLCK